MKKKLELLSCVLGFCCMVAGCVASSSWIGATEDDVITRFGVPEKSYMTHNQKYLVYDFTGIDYAFDSSNNLVTANENKLTQKGDCQGMFIINGGLVEKLIIQGPNCQINQRQK